MSAPDYPSTIKPGSIPELVRDDAVDLAHQAQDDLADIGEEVKQQAAALGEEAKVQIGELADKAKGMFGEQKDLLAGQLGGVSDALRKVADELEDSEQSGARYIRMIADQAQQLTSTLRDNDIDDVLATVQDFGRKQPAAFLGAAAILGFAASRFVMASASRPRQVRNGQYSEEARLAPSYSGVSKAPDYGQSVGGDDAGI
jgi:hypothetical protein